MRAAIFFLSLILIFSGCSKIENAAKWQNEINKGFSGLQTQSYADEKFLGKDAPGFEELKTMILKQIGYSEENNYPVRGITHTKDIVFLCLSTGDGDMYKMVAPMDTVRKWAKKEAYHRFFK